MWISSQSFLFITLKRDFILCISFSKELKTSNKKSVFKVYVHNPFLSPGSYKQN